MSYLLFNNEILVSDGVKVDRINEGALSSGLLDQVKQAHVCVVDADVLIASASESALDKKDGILAKKFGESYEGDYVLQDERIDKNIFQVVGIRSGKVKEIYSLVHSDKVITFVPYAVAVRKILAQQKFFTNRIVVLLDDLGNEKLITVFEGLKFSRTRTIFNDKAQQILPEIKRSLINFEKKLADQKDKKTEGYCLATNNKTLGAQLRESEKDIPIEILDSAYPALDGLKTGGFPLKYALPEEIIRKRRQQQDQKRTRTLLVSAVVLTFGALFYFYGRVNLSLARNSFEQAQTQNTKLEAMLDGLDPYIYRGALKRQKRIDYPLAYTAIAESLPVGYEMNSMGFYDEGSHWIMEEFLSVGDDAPYDDIPTVGALKGAHIKDSLVNNRPGKYLRAEL